MGGDPRDVSLSVRAMAWERGRPLNEPHTTMTLNTAQPTESATSLSCVPAIAACDKGCPLYFFAASS